MTQSIQSRIQKCIRATLLTSLGCLAGGTVFADDSLIDHDASSVSVVSHTSSTARSSSILDDDEAEQVGFFSLSSEKSSCDTACDTDCDSAGCDDLSKVKCCSHPWWAHRNAAFGEFLLLRPGNADHIFTIEQNDTVPTAFPTGPVGRVNIDDEAAYRVGFSWAASDCTSLVASWTKYEGDTFDSITRNGTNVLNSQIIHPSTLTTGASSLESSADYALDFQLIDLAYRHIWKTNDIYAINWIAGFRYGNMEQDLLTQQEISVATGLVTNDVQMDFNGFGSMFGFDAERRSDKSGMLIYTKGLTSFLAGDWRGTYRQTNQFGGGVVGNDYEDFRVTPVLEFELGLGWQSECGKWRFTAGYLTSAWYDAVSTRQYVNSVRSTNYTEVADTITFSGLTTHFERRF